MANARPYTASEKSEIYNRMYAYISNYASMHGHTATAQYLNTLAYSLTGLTSDRNIFTRIKTGKNGKTRVDVACDRLSAIWEEIVDGINWDEESPLPEYKPAPRPTPVKREQTPRPAPKQAPRNQPATSSSSSWDAICSEIAERVEADLEDKLDALAEAHSKVQAQRVEIVMDDGEPVQLDGVVHPVFSVVLMNLRMHHHVYLYGPAGTGKSVIAEQTAKALGVPFYSDQSLISKYDAVGTRAVDGTTKRTAFTNAFIDGGVYCLDEMDNCESPALTAINTPLANGYITIDGVTYNAHPDFYFVGCGNTDGRGADVDEYVSRNRLDLATLNRFTFIPVKYDPRIEESLSNGDSDLMTFAHTLRAVAETCRISLLFTYRNIRSIAEAFPNYLANMESTLQAVEGMGLNNPIPRSEQGMRSLCLTLHLLTGMSVADINILANNLRDKEGMSENVWYKALRALC